MSLKPHQARARIEAARVYLLITRSLCRRSPQAVLREALDAGVDVVQVREPELGDRALLEWVHLVREHTAVHRVPLVVNDRPDICLLAGAEGVHLGQEDLPPRAARELLGPDRLLGLSTHDREQVLAAREEPVDYLGLGPLFDTPTKGLPGRTAELIREALGEAHQPVFGIGGVLPGNAGRAAALGLRRVASCAGICTAEDPGAVVRELRRALEIPSGSS